MLWMTRRDIDRPRESRGKRSAEAEEEATDEVPLSGDDREEDGRWPECLLPASNRTI